MAREISPICDFMFNSLLTCLLMDTVDVVLTIRMVKVIYIYCKDHTVESTVLSLWSKSVIPFPSLRCKIQAFQDDSSKQTMTWHSSTMPQFFAPPRPHRSPRKCAPGKTRARWSNHNHWFNPFRTNRYNTHDTEPNDINKINIIQPTPNRGCEHTDGSCTYCKYEAPQPFPVPSDWSSEDWDGKKAKAREQKSLVEFMPPKLDTDPQTMEVMADDIPFSKLIIWSEDPDKNPAEVTNRLIPPLEAAAETSVADIPVAKTPEAEASVMDTAKSDDSTKTHYEMLEQELRMLREEEKYALFISILGKEEESDTETDTDDNTYTYFDFKRTNI